MVAFSRHTSTWNGTLSKGHNNSRNSLLSSGFSKKAKVLLEGWFGRGLAFLGLSRFGLELVEFLFCVTLVLAVGVALDDPLIIGHCF